MVADLDIRQEIAALHTKAEAALRNGAFTEVIIRCGTTLEAALKRLILHHDAQADIGRKELGRLIGTARQLGVCQFETVGKLDQVNKLRRKAAHYQETGNDDLSSQHAGDALRDTGEILIATGLLDATSLRDCKLDAKRRRSRPVSDPLSLDRTDQRGHIDGLGDRTHQLHVLAVHGEVEQGHHQCAELAFREVSQHRDSLWTRLKLKWPKPAAHEARLGQLVQRLGESLGLPRKEIAVNLEGAVAQVRRRVHRRLERGPLFVQHHVKTVRKEDKALLSDYLAQIWSTDQELLWPCVLTVEMARIEPGFMLTDTWRAARRGARHTAAICETLRQLRQPYLRGREIPELTSVTKGELHDWVLDHLEVHDPEGVTDELWIHSKNGRFERVLEHLEDYQSGG